MAVEGMMYDPKAIEGVIDCVPACLNQGVCQNQICFCLSPYGGEYCENDLGVATRVNILIFICMLIGGLALGFVIVFVLRFIWDCFFYKEPQANEIDADAWKA